MAGLLPREHGAWAQLAFPLLTGLILGRGAPGAFAFAGVAVAAFLAHEPAAVLRGARGVRLKNELAGRARTRLLWLGGALATGVLAAALVAPARAWQAATVPGVLGLLLVPLFLAGRLKSLGGEVLLTAALASLVLPLGRSGPAGMPEVALAGAVWFGAFVPPIVTVHALKARVKQRGRGRWLLVAAPLVALLVIAGALTAWALLPPWGRASLAVLPPAVATLGVAVSAPHPRHLKQVGWTVAAADVVALVLLLVL